MTTSPLPTSTTPPPTHDPPAVGLLDLPPELRNYIFSLSGCLRWHACAHCNRVVSGERLTPSGLDTREQDLYPDDLSDLPASHDAETRASFRANLRANHGDVPGPPYRRVWRPHTILLNNPYQRPASCPAPARSRIVTETHYYRSGTDRALGCGRVSQSFVDAATIPQPALTRVCRQLRAETLPVFYGSHRFVLVLAAYKPLMPPPPPPLDTVLWRAWHRAARVSVFHTLEAITPAHVKLIKHLGVVYVQRRQLGWIKDVLLPGLRARGLRHGTLRLGCTFKVRGCSYQKCGCMHCVLWKVGGWDVLRLGRRRRGGEFALSNSRAWVRSAEVVE